VILCEYDEMVKYVEKAIDDGFWDGGKALKEHIVEILTYAGLVARTVDDENKEEILKKLKEINLTSLELEARLKMVFPGEF